MADIDRIKQLADDVIERPDDYISLERIVSEIPMLDYENPITYHLYATYNKNIPLNKETNYRKTKKQNCEQILRLWGTT